MGVAGGDRLHDKRRGAGSAKDEGLVGLLKMTDAELTLAVVAPGDQPTASRGKDDESGAGGDVGGALCEALDAARPQLGAELRAEAQAA